MRRTTSHRRGEATCLLCGTTVGEIQQGRFIHHQACERPIRWQGRLPRCCRCGGSLYFDPAFWINSFSGIEDLPPAVGLES